MRTVAVANASDELRAQAEPHARFVLIADRHRTARSLAADRRGSLLSSARMPLIRCPKCGQAYDIPGVIAVRLPNSIATCHCGEWLSGSKAAVLARLVDVESDPRDRPEAVSRRRARRQPAATGAQRADDRAGAAALRAHRRARREGIGQHRLHHPRASALDRTQRLSRRARGGGAVDPPLLDLRARRQAGRARRRLAHGHVSRRPADRRGGDRRRRASAARRLGAGERRADRRARPARGADRAR